MSAENVLLNVVTRDKNDPLSISWRQAKVNGITCSTKPGDFRLTLYFDGSPSVTVGFFLKDSSTVETILNLLTKDYDLALKPALLENDGVLKYQLGSTFVEIFL
ncbi:hypothetical protein EBU71_06730 [bacterium]|jgi:hypothetical protein|nr:hypothetical protein [Candidatus Elulimicrobium humile]